MELIAFATKMGRENGPAGSRITYIPRVSLHKVGSRHVLPQGLNSIKFSE